MNLSQHLKPLGLLLGLMLLVTVTTALVALRLQPPAGAAVPAGAAQSSAPLVAGSGQAGSSTGGAAGSATAAAAPSGVAAPRTPGGGQCVSGATSLVESAALDAGIGGGLGAVAFPTPTPYPLPY